jgi:hypothetical protein
MMVRMADITITCEVCAAQFTLTTEQQQYYTETGYTMPSRCEICEKKHRDAREAERASRRPAKKKRRF